jgi:hypothetical protein
VPSTVAKQETAKVINEAEGREDSLRKRDADKANTGYQSNENQPAPKGAVGNVASSAKLKRAPSTSEEKTLQPGTLASVERRANDKSETRNVAGRRFYRRDGIWIDNEYNSSRATINVTRGSEQYRALVADEPGIKAITEQLSGPIIVVWKGRAYHIR